MNKLQLQELIAKPTLEKIPKGYSNEALMAFMMCVAHESTRGEYIKQVNGPALGLIQMEPKTHNSVWKFGDSVWDNALLLGIITADEYNKKLHPKPERLIYDLVYNVFMFRQRMFMKPKPIPKNGSAISMYLKEHWNSIHGAADRDWETFFV